MKTAVIIPAAGQSTRMGVQKQLIPLGGVPVLVRTIEAFKNHSQVDEIIVLVPKDMKFVYEGIKVVEGSNTRQSSVWVGLQHTSNDITRVLIHDAARPLVTSQIITDIINHDGCAISGVKSKDTIKITDSHGLVTDTPDRDNMWIVQTPQGFPKQVIVEAHNKAIAENFTTATDDAMLVERMGIPVVMVAGSYSNIKLTTPEDVKIAEALMGT